MNWQHEQFCGSEIWYTEQTKRHPYNTAVIRNPENTKEYKWWVTDPENGIETEGILPTLAEAKDEVERVIQKMNNEENRNGKL